MRALVGWQGSVLAHRLHDAPLFALLATERS